VQLAAREAAKSIVCHEGSNALFPNDIGENLCLQN